MAQTKVIGGGSIQPGVELAVDPTFLAARVAMRPLVYAAQGEVLGHYSAVQASGTTITLAAGDVVRLPCTMALLAPGLRWGGSG